MFISAYIFLQNIPFGTPLTNLCVGATSKLVKVIYDANTQYWF